MAIGYYLEYLTPIYTAGSGITIDSHSNQALKKILTYKIKLSATRCVNDQVLNDQIRPHFISGIRLDVNLISWYPVHRYWGRISSTLCTGAGFPVHRILGQDIKYTGCWGRISSTRDTRAGYPVYRLLGQDIKYTRNWGRISRTPDTGTGDPVSAWTFGQMYPDWYLIQYLKFAEYLVFLFPDTLLIGSRCRSSRRTDQVI